MKTPLSVDMRQRDDVLYNTSHDWYCSSIIPQSLLHMWIKDGQWSRALLKFNIILLPLRHLHAILGHILLRRYWRWLPPGIGNPSFKVRFISQVGSVRVGPCIFPAALCSLNFFTCRSCFQSSIMSRRQNILSKLKCLVKTSLVLICTCSSYR